MDDDKKRLHKNELELHKVVPEFNSEGRLCNYHTGEGETINVMREEWERFNRFAGRKHEIIDGVAVFNDELELCRPDTQNNKVTTDDVLANLIFELVDKGII